MYSPSVEAVVSLIEIEIGEKIKRYCSMYKKNLSELLPEFYAYKYSNL